MSVQVRRRREAASFLTSFVGAQGELLVDTTNNRVQVHDGTTPGGFPAAKLADIAPLAPLASPALTGTPTAPTPPVGDASTRVATTAFSSAAVAAVTARKSVSDAAYTVLATDRLVALTALTASRTLTLPAASAYPPGASLTLVDESGACSTVNAIVLAASGADTINGAASATIASANGYLALESNGSNRWTIIDQVPFSALTIVAQSASGANMQFGVLEQLVTLSGASVTSTLQIPSRSIVFSVSARTVTAVGGAPSYGVGVSGNTTQFGGALGASVGSANSGVIGPTAFYAPTSLVVTATSGSFTGGQVRLAIHYLLCGAPTS